jgi:hypothetical protein
MMMQCTISKAGAVSMIKALSEALLAESGRDNVLLRVWQEDDYRVGVKVNRDIAVFGIGVFTTDDEVQS